MSRMEFVHNDYRLSRCAKCGKHIPVDQQWEEQARIDAEWDAWQSGTTRPSSDAFHRHCRPKP